MSVMQMAEDRLAWIDTETTDLLPARPLLLELAIVVTDRSPELRVLGEFSRVIFQRRDRVLALMPPQVLTMHSRSGLIEELATTRPARDDLIMVEEAAVDFLVEYDAMGAPAAGSNVASFDRQVLELHMPDLNRNGLHYRNVDVTAVKELARGLAPSVLAAAPEKRHAHRALADVHESLEEMRHYIRAGFIRPEVLAASAAGCADASSLQDHAGGPEGCPVCGPRLSGAER